MGSSLVRKLKLHLVIIYGWNYMQGVNRADPCSSFMNDLCAQCPWVFGRITLLAAVSVANWSGQTLNAAVVYALPSPHKPLVAAMSGDFVLSFSHVCTGFIKMTSGVEISPLWLNDDVIDDKSLLHKKVCGFSSYREPEDGLWHPLPAWLLSSTVTGNLELQRAPERGEWGHDWCFMTASILAQAVACLWASLVSRVIYFVVWPM